MNDIPLSTFVQTIADAHGARARVAGQVPVSHEFVDGSVWSGHVLVFELFDHPTSQRCYAWESDGRVAVFLEDAEVRSPIDAVRAAREREVA